MNDAQIRALALRQQRQRRQHAPAPILVIARRKESGPVDMERARREAKQVNTYQGTPVLLYWHEDAP